MNRTFSDMKTNVGNNVQDTSSAMATIIGVYLNNFYFDLLRRFNFFEQNIRTQTITTVAGTKDYALNDDFHKEVYIRDGTNKAQLSRITLQQFIDDYNDTMDSSGTPDKYLILNSPVKAQPSATSVLAIISTSTSDTGTLKIRGISSGIEVAEDVTLTGTSSVNSANSYTEILQLTFGTALVGKVTITSNSAAVTVATVKAGTKDYRVKILRLHYTPSGIITITVPYIKRVLPLSDTNDVPIIDCADILELGATEQAWRYKRQFAKAQEFERLKEIAISNFIWDEENQVNQIHEFKPAAYSRETC